MPVPVTLTDHEDAARIAAAAGRLLMELRAGAAGDGLDVAGLRAEGDMRSNRFILGELQASHPHDAVLSEEAVDDPARLTAERVWIVDPLDGTREFGEDGRTDWAVHVALHERGRLTVGAVSLPALGLTLSTAPGQIPPVAERAPGPPRVVVSRSRPPACVPLIERALGAELVEMGSAGAKAMAVIRGEVDVYAHSGGQYEWDSAAPVAVAAAAGLHTSRLDGSPLRYNQPDPYLPDLLICRPELAATVIEAAAGET
jgi:3'(2'), 5'-bisphosphate nucleotidase